MIWQTITYLANYTTHKPKNHRQFKGPAPPLRAPSAIQHHFMMSPTSPYSTPPPTQSPVSPITRTQILHDTLIPLETTSLLDNDSRNNDRRQRIQDSYILGCAVLAMATACLLVLVTGLTTMVANSNTTHLEVYSDWQEGGRIPLKYGCNTPDPPAQSIPIYFKNIPATTTSLIILFANPSAVNTMNFDPVHWFVTDIPVTNTSLTIIPPNASGHLNGTERRNSWGETAYHPICTSGFFSVHVYAIDDEANIKDFVDAREIMNRFVGVPVARLTGIYGD